MVIFFVFHNISYYWNKVVNKTHCFIPIAGMGLIMVVIII